MFSLTNNPRDRCQSGRMMMRLIRSQGKLIYIQVHTSSEVPRWRNCDTSWRCYQRNGRSGQLRARTERLCFSLQKKDGKWAMCNDYSVLNKITVNNTYHLPKIEEPLDRLRGERYFTKTDLCSGDHQIQVQESDIQKTAFVTCYGSFEHLLMPYGLCNTPTTFQRIIKIVLGDGLGRFVVVFQEDILIFSCAQEDQHILPVL